MRTITNWLAGRKKVADTQMTFWELKELVRNLDDSVRASIDCHTEYYLHWLMDTERYHDRMDGVPPKAIADFLDDAFTGHPDVPGSYWRRWFDAMLRNDYDADAVASIENAMLQLDEGHRGRPKYRISVRHQEYSGRNDERHYLDVAASSYAASDDVCLDARYKKATIAYTLMPKVML
ncbi:MAG: hypothetical protein HYY37_02705 [Candidatus Aenigmarchaeota archaeon]|nr:hypothetical protein [Candidatus Aenigmarchaeota archaeon]